MSVFSEIWKSFRSTIRGFDSPHQLALGTTLGVMAGLLPLDSVLPYGIAAVAILTPGNLLCLAIAAVVTSLASPLLDPMTHSLGLAVLNVHELQSTFVWLIELPIIPWTRFNNSVVMGNLCLGMLSALPMYLISRTVFQTAGPRIFRAVAENRFVRRWTDSSTPQLQES